MIQHDSFLIADVFIWRNVLCFQDGLSQDLTIYCDRAGNQSN